jgi:hypothetical protein
MGLQALSPSLFIFWLQELVIKLYVLRYVHGSAVRGSCFRSWRWWEDSDADANVASITLRDSQTNTCHLETSRSALP